MERPKVGVGVIIENKEKKILIGKRKGSHSPFYSVCFPKTQTDLN